MSLQHNQREDSTAAAPHSIHRPQRSDQRYPRSSLHALSHGPNSPNQSTSY